jgi:putative PIN family toxin of toxin-antitoxin system
MKVESLRVVIDSNVWISAALSPDGAPAKVVRRVLEYGLAVFSPATFAELETRLWKPKFDRYLSMELRRRLLHDINAAAFWVDVPPVVASLSYCRDADDDKFIHTALAAQSPWLVTGDRDLLDVPAISGLRILVPGEAILLPEFSAAG